MTPKPGSADQLIEDENAKVGSGSIAAILIRNRNLSEAIPRCTRLVACRGLARTPSG
jgi:hypothetical protein